MDSGLGWGGCNAGRAGVVYNSPKHRGALDCLPFQARGFSIWYLVVFRPSVFSKFNCRSLKGPGRDKKSATGLLRTLTFKTRLQLDPERRRYDGERRGASTVQAHSPLWGLGRLPNHLQCECALAPTLAQRAAALSYRFSADSLRCDYQARSPSSSTHHGR